MGGLASHPGVSLFPFCVSSSIKTLKFKNHTIKFNNNFMSSENETSINVCLLGNVKVGALLGLGVRWH